MAQNFEQLELEKPSQKELPIVPSDKGAILQEGEFSSPNYAPRTRGWRMTSEGLLEAVEAEVTNLTIVQTLTAGEAFAGATTPVPVFVGDGTETDLRPADSTGSSFTLNTTEKLAFKYTPAADETINIVKVRAQRDAGMSSDVKVSVQPDSAGQPSGTVLGYAIIPSTDFDSGSENLVSSPVFNVNVTLMAGISYWIVVEYVTTTETDGLIIDHTTGGVETTATYDGATWTVDDSSNIGIAITVKYIGGELFQSDADVTARSKFHGFVINTVALGSSVAAFMFSGIITAFSNLTPGATYYVSNTRGTIGTSPGSTSIEVGKALSDTKLLIKAY